MREVLVVGASSTDSFVHSFVHSLVHSFVIQIEGHHFGGLSESSSGITHDLRSVFLGRNNFISGRYFAELARENFRHWHDPTLLVEYRISVHGYNKEEWDSLASWVLDNDLQHVNNRWLIQLPQSYATLARGARASSTINSFQDILDNVFLPLFQASIDPASHPKLDTYLRFVSGFDISNAEGSQHEQELSA